MVPGFALLAALVGAGASFCWLLLMVPVLVLMAALGGAEACFAGCAWGCRDLLCWRFLVLPRPDGPHVIESVGFGHLPVAHCIVPRVDTSKGLVKKCFWGVLDGELRFPNEKITRAPVFP